MVHKIPAWLRCVGYAMATFVAGTASAHAMPFVVNGAFSTNASGWTLVSACSDSVFDAGEGNLPGAVRLNSCGQSNSDPTASQTVSGFDIGTTYELTWDIKVHVPLGAGTGKSFGFFLDSQPGNPLLMTEFLDGSWHTLMKSFVATTTSHTLIFAAELDARTPGQLSTTDVSYYLDNVSLSEAVAPVPEPASLLLSALGLGILAQRRRAQQKMRTRQRPETHA